ncbi:MAG: NUDIX hydrolase [Candidatus Thermoplasmatota archaeon]|jgi:8-oxo-dGTP diphosphatase|nr:NUDIX hydrolase [Candidatus Thermoplasmatota archaeon]
MRYKSPSLTTDGVIIKNGKILLIKRKNEPFKGKWALPGGFVEYGEKVEEAIVREIKEETGLITKIKEPVGIYSDPKRDPRGHVVSIVFLLDIIDGKLKADDDALDVKFFDLKKLPDLSFDHDIIINDIKRRIKDNVLS